MHFLPVPSIFFFFAGKNYLFMEAIFNIQVKITSEDVDTTLNFEKVADADTVLFGQFLKSFDDFRKKLRTQLVKFSGTFADRSQEEHQAAVAPPVPVVSDESVTDS